MADTPVKYSSCPLVSKEIEALPENLPGLVASIIPAVESAGWSANEQNRIELVLEEAMLNVALHGYDGKGGWLKVSLEAVDDGSLLLSLEDAAIPFDPLGMPSPDCSLAMEERNIGGLGVHLVRNMSDGLSYSFKEGHNCLQLTFRQRT